MRQRDSRKTLLWAYKQHHHQYLLIFYPFAVVAGGEDPTEGFKNLAINGISVLVLSFLLNRDLQTSARDRAVVKREEALARLQACIR